MRPYGESLQAVSRVETIARLFAIGMVAAIGIVSIWAASGLYADGSFYALEILLKKSFAPGDEARVYDYYVTQWPVVAALKSGIDDINVLMRWHTAGLQIVLAFWIGALWLQFREKLFWSLLFCFCVSYLTCGLFLIGEYNYAAALTGLAAAALLKNRPLGFVAATIVVLCAVGLIRAYETTAFLGPALIAICLGRICLRDGESKTVTALLLVSVALLAIGTAVAACSILFPLRPRMLSGAMNVSPLLRSPHTLFLGFVGALMMVAMALRGRLHFVVVAIGILVSLAYATQMRWWHSPAQHYDFRAVSGLFLLTVLGIMVLLFFGDRYGLTGKLRPPNALAPMALACFLALLVPFFHNLIGFRQWAANFEQNVLEGSGIIAIEKAGLVPSPYVWTWTNPTMSAVLKGDQAGAVIENPAWYKEWVPFPASDTPVLQTYRKNGRLYQFGER